MVEIKSFKIPISSFCFRQICDRCRFFRKHDRLCKIHKTEVVYFGYCLNFVYG